MENQELILKSNQMRSIVTAFIATTLVSIASASNEIEPWNDDWVGTLESKGDEEKAITDNWRKRQIKRLRPLYELLGKQYLMNDPNMVHYRGEASENDAGNEADNEDEMEPVRKKIKVSDPLSEALGEEAGETGGDGTTANLYGNDGFDPVSLAAAIQMSVQESDPALAAVLQMSAQESQRGGDSALAAALQMSVQEVQAADIPGDLELEDALDLEDAALFFSAREAMANKVIKRVKAYGDSGSMRGGKKWDWGGDGYDSNSDEGFDEAYKR